MNEEIPAIIHIFNYTKVHDQWQIGFRQLPEDLIYVITDGVCTGSIAGRPIRCEHGTAFWLPAGTEHHFRNVPDEKNISVYHLRVHLPQSPSQPLITRRSDSIVTAMQRLLELHHTTNNLHKIRFRCALIELLACFDEALHEAQDGNVLTAHQRRALLQFMQGIAPGQRPRSADLAACCQLTPNWFSRVFTRTYGCNPRSWIKRTRLQRAAELICESDLPIGEVADIFGYDEAFRFSRQFREVMGCSPRQWRQQHRIPHQPQPRYR